MSRARSTRSSIPRSRLARDRSAARKGCLSIPDIFGEVERAGTVTVTALNENGEQIEVVGSEPARSLPQHEIDHLHGKLFLDYLSVLKRRAALAKWDGIKADYPGYIRR
jgi:peptide deformylase